MKMSKLSLVVILLLLLLQLQHQSLKLVLCYTREDFPPQFVFGSGTSAYQVEGAVLEDGRKPSVVDILALEGEYGGEIAEVTCDEYHKYKEDVQLMADIGLDAYRFSISWSRVIPNGSGPVNLKGVEYYNNLINELVKNGIQPHVTLSQFDHPQALEDAYGGWKNPQMVKDFTNYAELCFREFGDRVSHWITINEPNFYAIHVHRNTTPYVVGHNMLLGHASAVKLYREKYQAKQRGVIGLSIFTSWYIPETNTERDIIAAKRVRDSETGWFIDPLVFGDYPNRIKQVLGSSLPALTEQESKLVKGSFDFIGVICYNATIVRDDPAADVGLCMKAHCQFKAVGGALMQAALEYFKHAYGNPPIYICENGFRTLRHASLQDTTRINFLNDSIGGLLNAVRNGSDVRGYFQWSLMDLFEFVGGYTYAYGLYYVDMNDSNRTRYPKLSSQWYSAFLKGESFGHENGIIQQINNSSLISQEAVS